MQTQNSFVALQCSLASFKLPTLSQDLPVFTKFQVEETCVEEGENITISCSLSYPVNDLIKIRRIFLLKENLTFLALGSNKIHFNLTVLENESHFQAVIPKVDKDWLNKKYYCQAASHPQVVSGAMYVSGGPCAKVAETNSIVHEVPKESNLSVAIAVP
ncbi:hypothetical protein EB796_024985 [Bugula neritina]|uniref:Uncharacterized protein n=1 Tax=Bugula neritina TaxID=10212 RepID=A0A7J7IRX5_BUGNE|nr:hypothetical protein EB796_024985 [Bugula neritina]